MPNEITRRVRNEILNETIEVRRDESEGPDSLGGRTYDILYAPGGRVRVDLIGGYWSSEVHTLFIERDEIRPREEWIDHLLTTGQTVRARTFCQHCGLEKPGGSR